MLTALRHVLEMIRFSHTLFALPFALLAAVMAWTTPSPGGRQIEFRWVHLAWHPGLHGLCPQRGDGL